MLQSSTRLDWLRYGELALAASVLVATWLDIGAALRSYPTWVYVAEVTLPFSVFLPTALAVVTLAAVGVEFRSGRPLGFRRVAAGVLAGLTVVTTGFAVFNLNTAEPGVYAAAIFPMFFGILLAVLVLGGRGVDAARSASAA